MPKYIHPDIEANRGAYDIRSWEISPGDVIFAHPGVLHGGGPTGLIVREEL